MQRRSVRRQPLLPAEEGNEDNRRASFASRCHTAVSVERCFLTAPRRACKKKPGSRRTPRQTATYASNGTRTSADRHVCSSITGVSERERQQRNTSSQGSPGDSSAGGSRRCWRPLRRPAEQLTQARVYLTSREGREASRESAPRPPPPPTHAREHVLPVSQWPGAVIARQPQHQGRCRGQRRHRAQPVAGCAVRDVRQLRGAARGARHFGGEATKSNHLVQKNNFEGEGPRETQGMNRDGKSSEVVGDATVQSASYQAATPPGGDCLAATAPERGGCFGSKQGAFSVAVPACLALETTAVRAGGARG